MRSFPFIKPCLPSLRTHPPRGDDWLHEIKLDGWRGQLHKCAGAVRLYSKRGNDLSFRFPDLLRSVARLPIDDVILDGEITALDDGGLPNFEALQRADRRYQHTFWAFDLLWSGEKAAAQARKIVLQREPEGFRTGARGKGAMLIGYMRVSKADGSQVLDLQRDALLAAGVEPAHTYQAEASGSKDDRPGLAACPQIAAQGRCARHLAPRPPGAEPQAPDRDGGAPHQARRRF